ncbi:MAG TPA: MAPEG family protein [Caulobacteraceae bacterium]|nr:MAPEG family protein [Caulobacteraceae bacterium]
MQTHALVAVVSLLALLVYFYMSLRVGRARSRYKIAAPAVTGDPNFERDYRIQMNTLEWLPLFLVSLWLFAIYWNSDLIASLIGLVWIVGRILYMTGYARAAKDRELGFMIQALAAGVLLFGALGRAIWIALRLGI